MENVTETVDQATEQAVEGESQKFRFSPATFNPDGEELNFLKKRLANRVMEADPKAEKIPDVRALFRRAELKGVLASALVVARSLDRDFTEALNTLPNPKQTMRRLDEYKRNAVDAIFAQIDVR